jgi:hypothetical protein
MMVPCKVEIYKKIDKDNVFTGYETSPTVFTRLVQSVKIDRRLSTNVATANVDIFYAGYNEELILFQYGGWGDKIPLLDNFNRIKIYIDNKIQFCGIIINYNIDDEKAVVNISCQDMFYQLNRAVDCRVPYIQYQNIYVFDMLKDLAAKAGIATTLITTVRGENYHIDDIKIKYDTQISDVFSDAAATSNTRNRCLKTGELAIEDMYHTYEYSDVPNNTNYEFEYTYTKRINSSAARRGGETLYNRLLVRFNDKTYNVYDNPTLFNYMCAQNKFKEVQTTLGDTQEKRFRLANRTFRNDTREITTLTLDAVDGNPDLDLGMALRVNLDNRIGHYMVVGISTSYSADGYFDNVDIEGLLPTNYISCELGKGNYDDNGEDSSSKSQHYVTVKANVPSTAVMIKSSKANKMGKFLVNSTGTTITIKCEFDNSNAGVSIMDPSGVVIGLESNPAVTNDTAKLTKAHGNMSITGLGTCSEIDFTIYPGLTQIVTIKNPIHGTWLIRGVGTPTETVGCVITCSVDWTLLNEDAEVMDYTSTSGGAS